MQSIYQQALGSDFQRLHPCMQQRFGFHSRSGIAVTGRGIMERIWHGAYYTLPFLYLGTWRRIMFPEQCRNVPFTIENYAYCDDLGRETVTWVRTFFMPHQTRRFDAYMIYSPTQHRIVDYLGSHQHLAVDLDVWVDDYGGVRIRSGTQRFYEGLIGFRFPLLFSGIAEVGEWYDEREGRFRIEVRVHNRAWGPLFGYRGWFNADWYELTPENTPVQLLPRRIEARE